MKVKEELNSPSGQRSTKTIVLISFVILKFLLQYLLLSPEYDLQRDEYLHLDQGDHLAWGYLSVPPFTSWNSLLIKLLGGSVFWVKFFPALFGALTMVVVWKTIEELKGNLFALILGATCVLFSVLLRLNMLYQPNSFDVLCWTFVYFILIKYINTENVKWLFTGAVVFALGFLNKYNIIFLAMGVLPALLLTPQRNLLAKKAFYIAALLALLLVLPNLIWQYQNNFPVFHHLKALSETQLVHVDRWIFLRSQLLFFIGSTLVIVAGLYALLFYAPFKKYQLFFWSILFTLIVFLYFKAKDYYAIGIYPIYIAFGSVYVANISKEGRSRVLQPIALAIPLLFFIPMYRYAFPNKSPEFIVNHQERYKKIGMLRWEDGKDHELPQDFADMLGWKELARKVDRVYSNFKEADKTLVLCDNYGQTGAVNYYTTKGIKASSFNADYVNWFDLNKKYNHLIRVINRSERESEIKEHSQYFEQVITVDSIANPFAREYGAAIVLFLNAKVDVNKAVMQEVEEVRNWKGD
ncbi:glycosyltransferase family 39 protein [Chryseosolibacter indicus]|uniref:Glycosyltransferase family 39 protein n=1 Tax=Chryseosolibacter indicus TaxID=2782351 RepID=A0ABS5VRZ9_9BACT|nr:glycosyltransferase family 39 protein [Chryseosolibacter indicus]MBT1704121.1 glycosyltransferase family 39 protein [Chryseosolibacter indicus]